MSRWMSCSMLLVVLANPALAATFTVDSDLGDAPTDLATPGSLGWAVYQANNNPGPDYILFEIPSDGSPVTIQPIAEYVLTDPGTEIKGYTQAGAQQNMIIAPGGLDAVLMISVDGSQIADGGRAVFRLETDDVLLEGLNIHSGPVAEVAICLEQSQCSGNHVSGCYIGTDPTGTLPKPSGWSAGNPPYAIGVWLANGARGNWIGDYILQEDRCLISGERRGDDWLTGIGVLFDGTNEEVNNNHVVYSRIGTDVNGDALPNTIGIAFINGATYCESWNNAIAGNSADGIVIDSTTDSANIANYVYDNVIGLSVDGTSAVPNGGAGVHLGRGCEITQISQGILGRGNVISGNLGPGIRITEDADVVSRDNTVSYNLIGLTTDGHQALGNGGPGILIERAHGEHIFYNTISGNQGHGVQLANGRMEDIHDNRIGLAVEADDSLPNEGDGIRIECGPDDCSYDNDISDNIISANLGNGVAMFAHPDFGVSNSLLGNTIEANQGNGIYVRAGLDFSDTSGNQIRANGQDGIHLAGAGSFELSNNTIEANQGYGVRLVPHYGADASPATAGDDVISRNRLTGNTIQANALGGVRAVDTSPLNARSLHEDNTFGDNNGLPRVEVLWYVAVELLDESLEIIDAGAYTIDLLGADGSHTQLAETSSLPTGAIWGPAGMAADEERTWALVRDFVVDADGEFTDANPYSILVTGPTTGSGTWTFDANRDNDPGGDVGTPSGVWTGSLYRYQVAQVDTLADSDGDGVDDPDDCAPTDPDYQGAGGAPCDADGDGYCDAAIDGNVRQAACPNDCPLPICPPTDCDDTDLLENPGADEIFCNFEDDDCDPATGDDPDPADADGDGYTAGCGQDCDDADPESHPGAEEICEDGVDQDCNGADLDCGCTDADGDGYADVACGGNDCDDTDPAIHPNVSELCNSVDDDCDGQTDEDFGSYICGVGVCQRTVDICVDGEYQSCVPLEPPEQTETTCNDGLDNDCDDYVDAQDLDCAGCQNPDADGDDYDGVGCGGADCDDSDPAVNPSADEDCDNGIDDDCNGLIDTTDPSCGKAGGCSCATRTPSPAPALLALLLLGLAALRRKQP